YTFWKRTAAPPQMTTLDAPSRETCTVRRERTNTPLQALLLLNDVQYIEASRALAQRTLRDGGNTDAEKISLLFRLGTCRKPDARELSELTGELAELRKDFKANPEGARKLLRIGEMAFPPGMDPSEAAAWTILANTVLNLDEVLNKS
ncbi:MAG: DUF1553 domain-containing protein, partial [Gemmataceae bacterium]